MRFPVRVAREDAPGQYVLQSDKATLLLCERGTLSLASHEPLFHASLQHLKLGASRGKLLVVPLDRTPCWLCEFTEAGAGSHCATALQARGVELTASGGEPSGESTASHATSSHAASLVAQLQRLPPHELESVIEALIPQTA
jgi:hypothetical protein